MLIVGVRYGGGRFLGDCNWKISSCVMGMGKQMILKRDSDGLPSQAVFFCVGLGKTLENSKLGVALLKMKVKKEVFFAGQKFSEE